jgi:hypothetical protein
VSSGEERGRLRKEQEESLARQETLMELLLWMGDVLSSTVHQVQKICAGKQDYDAVLHRNFLTDILACDTELLDDL